MSRFIAIEKGRRNALGQTVISIQDSRSGKVLPRRSFTNLSLANEEAVTVSKSVGDGVYDGRAQQPMKKK